MKLKEGMAVKNKETGKIGIIKGTYPGPIDLSRAHDAQWIVYFKEQSGGLCYESILEPLPNHFINNPGKWIMKVRVYGDKETGFYNRVQLSPKGPFARIKHSWLDHTTEQGARKALKKWAKAYGVNVEIVG